MGLILYEYRCERCGKTIESLEPSGTATIPHCTDSLATRIISAVAGYMKAGSVVQGKRHTDDRPDWCLNTEGLADGQDPTEWRAKEMKRLTGRDQAENAGELAERGASVEVGSDIL